MAYTEERAVKATMHIARAPDRVAHTLLDSIVENYKPALDELSLDAALDVEPPFGEPGAEQETLDRHAKLRRPAVARAHRRRFPNGVPIRVL